MARRLSEPPPERSGGSTTGGSRAAGAEPARGTRRQEGPRATAPHPATGSAASRHLALRLGLGGVLWLGYLAVARPTPFDPAWPHALLLLAALALVPLGLALADDREAAGLSPRSERLLGWAAAGQLPAAACLAVAYARGQGTMAALLALPWLAFATTVAAAGIVRFRAHAERRIADIVTDGGLVFLLVGAAGVVADRLGHRPLGLAPILVLLTAVHFHFAGFVLPVAAGLAIRHVGGASATLAGWGVIAGVPAVAIGITASHLGLGTATEAVAAWTMAGAGALVAYLHFRLSLQPRWPAAAAGLWAFAGLSLVASMGFAALYGARFLLPEVRWLDIGWMQALHGALNAFGFGAAVLAAWALVERPFRQARRGRSGRARRQVR